MEARPNKKPHQIKIDMFIRIYLLTYVVVILFYNLYERPIPRGEWDDYALPVISIINERNFSISPSDVEKAKIIYSDWAAHFDNYRLSGYKTRAGGEMSWYFPTYSFACIPLTLLLYFSGLPAVYAFPLTNIAVVMGMAYIIWKYMRCGDKRRFALIVLLTANPIAFYYSWPSAESFIFAMIGIALVFWHNKWWKRAAFFISIAGSLNPVVMVIGMGMIVDYIFNILHDAELGNTMQKRIIKSIPNTFLLGCCFFISIVPMIYNYYNVHAINLSASIPSLRYGSKDTILGRFLAYLFDLNFGFLPYYGPILLLSIILIPFSIIKRKWKYILCVMVECGLVSCYSMVSHINCGMSGIARYNAWGAVVMLFAVCCYGDIIIENKAAKKVIGSILATSALITSFIVYSYGPVSASALSSYVYMTPIAELVLTKTPALYNPLHSTFASRIEHRDGAYNYKTPIAYHDQNNLLRKLLVSPEDKQIVLDTYFGNSNAIAWLVDKLDSVSDEEYISVPSYIHLEKVGTIEIGEKVFFSGDDYNASYYFSSGVSAKEEFFSWTDGNEACFKLRINGASGQKIAGNINISDVYNSSQRVHIFVNNVEVLNTTATCAQTLSFSFVPETDYIEIKLELPDAISPYELGQSRDTRKLALQLLDMSFDINE